MHPRTYPMPPATCLTAPHALVQSPYFQWMPGMRTTTELRIDGTKLQARCNFYHEWYVVRPVRLEFRSSGKYGEDSPIFPKWTEDGLDLPDLTDAATVGCVLDILCRIESARAEVPAVAASIAVYGLTDPRAVNALVAAIVKAPAT